MRTEKHTYAYLSALCVFSLMMVFGVVHLTGDISTWIAIPLGLVLVYVAVKRPKVGG